MRYRIANGRAKVVPPQAARPPRPGFVNQVCKITMHSNPLIPAARTFRPLSWPGTTRDVTWTSTPVFGRAPSGWCRQGFYA